MKLLILCWAVITRSVMCSDCVTYNFEDDFLELFSNEGYCAAFPNAWTLGFYNVTSVSPPDERSSSFIVPASALSCASSFVFTVSEGGTLEVNLFITSLDASDQVVVMVYASETNTFLGQGFAISVDGTPMMYGYHTIEVYWQTFTGSMDAYVVFIGQASPGSTVFIDSFRYIPPNESEETCPIYEDIIEATTIFTTIEPETESVTEEIPTIITTIETTVTYSTTELTTETTTEDITTTQSITTDSIPEQSTIFTTTDSESETVTEQNSTTTDAETIIDDTSTTQFTTTNLIPDQTTVSTTIESDSTTVIEEITTFYTTEYSTIETTTEFYSTTGETEIVPPTTPETESETVTDEIMLSTTNNYGEVDLTTVEITNTIDFETIATTTENIEVTAESTSSENVVTSDVFTTTENPINPGDKPWSSRFWNPITISCITVLCVIVMVLITCIFYNLGKRKGREELLASDVHYPQRTVSPYPGEPKFGNNRSLMY